jgi:hypothetical protein
VDAAGARELRWRIEQQEHWRQAAAVVDGRQPRVDPDMNELVSLGEGLRVYSERFTFEGRFRLCKRLVGGLWEPGTIEDPGEELAPPAAPFEPAVRVA